MIGYIYPTNFGTFSIFPDAAGRWRLEMNGQYCSVHGTVEDAASAVYNCASGHIDWDSQGVVESPRTLSEWQASRVKPSR